MESGTLTVGSNGKLSFEKAVSKSYLGTWEFKTSTNSEISLNMGNYSLSAVDSSTAIMETRFAKSLNGIISLDFTSFVLSDDFVAGNEYKIALVYNSSGQNADGQFDSTWNVLSENVTNGKFAEFVSATKDGSLLSVTVRAVPEPSTYAAIFGALALAFVVWRKRQ